MQNIDCNFTRASSDSGVSVDGLVFALCLGLATPDNFQLP